VWQHTHRRSGVNQKFLFAVCVLEVN